MDLSINILKDGHVIQSEIIDLLFLFYYCQHLKIEFNFNTKEKAHKTIKEFMNSASPNAPKDLRYIIINWTSIDGKIDMTGPYPKEIKG